MKKQIIITSILASTIFLMLAVIFIVYVKKDDDSYVNIEKRKVVMSSINKVSTKKKSKVETPEETPQKSITLLSKKEAAMRVQEELESKYKCKLDMKSIALKEKEMVISNEQLNNFHLHLYVATVSEMNGRRFECKVNRDDGSVSDVAVFQISKKNEKISERTEENGMITRKICDQNVKPFEKIVYDYQSGADLYIEKGDHYGIDAEVRGYDYTLSYEIKNKVLSIKSDTKDQLSNEVPDHTKYVKITVPDKKLTNIDIDSNIGDIELKKVSSKKTTIDTGCGNVRIFNCAMDSCTTNPCCGETVIAGWKDGDLSINSPLGDIKIACLKPRKDYFYTEVNSIPESLRQNKVPGENLPDAKNKITINTNSFGTKLTFKK